MIKYIIAVILILPVLLVMLPLFLIMGIKPELFPYKFRYSYVRFNGLVSH